MRRLYVYLLVLKYLKRIKEIKDTYDNNGNLITKTNKTTGALTQYFWDYENRLKKIIRPGATVVKYKYDPFGRRIKKDINGVITKYLYDNEDIVTEYDGTGAVAARYTHGPGIDEPLRIKKGGANYYYHADALGSIKTMTDSTGSAVKTYIYKAYGTIASQTGTLIQPYNFTGREYDSEIGMYYYRGRYYYPSRGRFISKDPIGFGGGDVNLYRYVGNNPVNFTDPFGLDRYNPCKDLPLLGRWACKKYVNWGCSGAKESVCCEAEKQECLQKAIPEKGCKDDKEAQKCNIEYEKCMFKIKEKE
ncbi:MAG: RHS repeat-associated core domain-containing protein [Nitrospirae bacterium]|nr:RHS repeat-associated core domain-containing protein [Nitrospirota bacterium]